MDGIVNFLAPATIVDFAGIGGAIALHEGSTLLVPVRALRLPAQETADAFDACDPKTDPGREEAST